MSFEPDDLIAPSPIVPYMTDGYRHAPRARRVREPMRPVRSFLRLSPAEAQRLRRQLSAAALCLEIGDARC